MSGGADVVCQGWLRKSPPEKKLRRYAWKRRWFVLRSGRMTGDPDVLEYYKHDHARKPIRTINMSLCEQVDAGLTFNQKDLDSSYVFDVRTLDRVFYLVADSEEDMNRWVRSICDLCGFNPTDSERPAVIAQSTVVNVTTGHTSVSMATSTITAPPPHESVSSQEDGGTDYLWLSHCQSKTPQRPPVGSTSSDTTDNSDNTLLSHWALPSSSSSSLVNGHPSQPRPHTAPWAVAKEINHFNHSQDSAATPDLYRGWTRGHMSPHPRKHSLQLQAVSLPSICNDMVFTTGGATTINTQLNSSNNSSYQVPRASSVSSVGSDPPSQGDTSSTPPPRPPKPLASAPADSSSLGSVSALVPQTTSETDWSHGGRGGERGARGSSCSSVTSPDCCHAASQESRSVPRPVSEQTGPSMFDFTDSFNSYFINKGMVPLSGQTNDDDMDENYVRMSASNPSLTSSSSPSSLPPSLPEPPPEDTSYVSMTPCPGELPALGRQVPPPAHLVFRSSPVTHHTPPIRRHTSGGGMGRGRCDFQPPPIHRNLKPRKVKPAPLDIKPLQEWEELPAPVRSPVTRTFTRDPSSCSLCPPGRPASCPSSASSSDSEDPDDNYVAMITSSLATPAVESKPCDESPMVQRRDESPMVLRRDESPMVLRRDESPMVQRRDESPMVQRRDESPMVQRRDESPMVQRRDESPMVLRRDDGPMVLRRNDGPMVLRREDSPMVLRRPRGDKQVEYLDLDLHTGGVATPPRQKRSVLGGSMGSSDGERSRARVDYVVVDPERTRALKSTREAWHDGRQSIEKEK